MAELCCRSLMTFINIYIYIYYEKHFIPIWILRSIFVRYLVQRLKGLVSWTSPGGYSMIGRFLGDDFGARFVLPVLEYCSAVWYSASNATWPCSQWCSYLNCGLVCLSVTLLIVDLWQYYICCIYKIRCNLMALSTLFMVFYLYGIFQCGLHAVLWSHIGILMCLLAAEPRITSEL